MFKIKNLFFTLSYALFFALLLNITFFHKLIGVYPINGANIVFLLSLAINIYLAILLLFNFFRFKILLKPASIFFVLMGAVASYVMHEFGTPIDSIMILNVLSTNSNEAFELFSWSFVGYVFILGLLPALFIAKVKISHPNLKQTLKSQFIVLFSCLVLIVSSVALQSKFYASFFREHKPLRAYVNPIAWVYAIEKYSFKSISNKGKAVERIGADSHFVHNTETPKREIIIVVVGETARADHFSLNGYKRETFPLLAQQKVFSFHHMSSCGTSTAVSVPCIFSKYDRSHFDFEKGKGTENVLDVLNKTGGVKVLWRDNNSDSKGVAVRVDYQDYKTSATNPECGDECRDIGMLSGLKEFIEAEPTKDILIVLHQMGNHGPAYYKRYPKEFEKFAPACHTNELSKCSGEEIINAYDNALLYTDYFLSQVIELLKQYPKNETAMFYFSDHGESLGENGVYLHSMPYFIAPEAQKHVGSVIWFGGDYDGRIDRKTLLARMDNEYSHDNIFHTLLGLFEVRNKLYRDDMDIFSGLIDNLDD